MSQVSLKERQRQLREEVIIDNAYQMLLELGFDAMSMDAVAAKVGISKATLYQHFQSKEELAVNVVIRLVRLSIQDIMSNLDPSLKAFERLKVCLRTGLTRRTQFWNARLTLPPTMVKKNPRYCAIMGEMGDIIETLIEQAKREGDIDPTISTPVVVQIIIALFRSEFEDLITSGKATTTELIDTLTLVVTNGVRKHAS